MSLKPGDITIAVTVYDRRDYLQQSIGSALDQTCPVQVTVVEDCGPDRTVQDYVRNQFGNRVRYFRSPRRRGIFGNWNACIEQCTTPWLSILHDDDYLKPNFIAAMLELHLFARDCRLYYGRTIVVDSQEKPRPEWEKPPLGAAWAPVHLQDVLFSPPFSFPGHLFHVAAAKQLGQFRETSRFTGEWELWTKLIAHYGAAQTDTTVAVFRDHRGWNRGTTRVFRTGKALGLATVQCKRNLALAAKMGVRPPGCRSPDLIRPPVPTPYLLYYAKYFSPLYLAYNMRRYLKSPAHNWAYRLCQLAARIGGARFVRMISTLWNLVRQPH